MEHIKHTVNTLSQVRNGYTPDLLMAEIRGQWFWRGVIDDRNNYELLNLLGYPGFWTKLDQNEVSQIFDMFRKQKAEGLKLIYKMDKHHR